MRVFVAGATGVIGRSLVPRLVAAGHQVTGMTRTDSKAVALRATGVGAVVADALDPRQVAAAIAAARPDAIIHALTDIPHALEPRRWAEQFASTDRLRSEGTRNLVDAAVDAGVRRVVAESYAGLYARVGGWVKTEDDPLDVGATDGRGRTAAALTILEQLVTGTPGFAGTALRLGMLYGPGTALGRGGAMEAAVLAGRLPLVGAGDGVVSFVHVDDAAEAFTAALASSATGTLNIVDDEPAAYRDWLPVYASSIGARPPRRLPSFVVRLIAGSTAVSLLTEARGALNAKASQQIGWRPAHPSWREGFRAQA